MKKKNQKQQKSLTWYFAGGSKNPEGGRWHTAAPWLRPSGGGAWFRMGSCPALLAWAGSRAARRSCGSVPAEETPRRRRGDAEAVRPLDSSSLFRTIETCWNDCELRMSRGVSEVSVFSVPLGPANGIIFISGGGGNVRPCVWCVQPPLFCTCPVQSHSRAVIPVRKPLERGGAFLMGKSYRMRLNRG